MELSLRQDEHLDELVRELQLISADQGNSRSQALAAQIQDLLISPAHARFTGRRLAEQAAAAGQDVVDIDMAMPHEFSIMVQRLQQAVMAADQLCEQMELLTVASPPELRALRAWMTRELVAQIDHGEASRVLVRLVARQRLTLSLAGPSYAGRRLRSWRCGWRW